MLNVRRMSDIKPTLLRYFLIVAEDHQFGSEDAKQHLDGWNSARLSPYRGDGVRLRDLREENVIWSSRTFHPAFYDRLMAACKARDYQPRFTFEVTTPSGISAFSWRSPQHYFLSCRHPVTWACGTIVHRVRRQITSSKIYVLIE